MTDFGTTEFETALRADDRWLRALARKLVRDPDLASDLAQQTWLSVITSTRDGAPHRGLLRAAFQHVLANFRRGDERRRRREADGGEAQPEPDVADLVARVETQRALSAALLALAEPYRETLMRRYVEGLSPKAIASRANLSVDTVKTRLKRGLELLRAAIVAHTANDAPKRERFGFGLCALARWTPLKALGWKGLAMATSAKVLSSAAAIVIVAAGAWFAMSERSEAVRTSDAPTAAASTPESNPIEPTQPVDGTRVAVAPVVTERTDAAPAVTAQPSLRIDVRVRDVDLKPLSDIEVCATVRIGRERHVLATGRSDRDGRVALVVTSTDIVSVGCVDDAWIECTDNVIKQGVDEATTELIVAQRVRVHGVVVDETDRPIAGAHIYRDEAPRLEERVTTPLVGASIVRVGAGSNARGTFDLDSPWIPGAHIIAYADGCSMASVPLPQVCDKPLRLVLKRQAAAWLRGHVLTSDGKVPEWGASVAIGPASATTELDGRFELPLGGREPATLLRAVAPGFLPGEVERPESGWPDDVEIRLGGEPKTIAGIVLDANGQPMRGVQIVVLDPTAIEAGNETGDTFEAIASGEWASITTNDEGRFEVKGLLPRAYSLIAFDTRTLLSTRTQPVAADTHDLVITLPTQTLMARVRGKVMFTDGIPAAGVRVVLRMQVRMNLYSAPPDVISTDEHGAFELVDVPPADVRLVVDGDGIVPRLNLAIEDTRADNFAVTVERGVSFCIHLPPGIKDSKFRVVDAHDQPLTLYSGKPGSRGWTEVVALNRGASQIWTVADRATTLVYFTNRNDGSEVELRRVPLQLKPGEVTVITQ